MIALFLMLTITATLVILPVANAHDPAWTIPTYAYVAAAPNTVGVGQYTLIIMWIDWVPPTAGGLGGDRWKGFKLDITKPDGSKETLGPFTSGPVGTTFATYTPDQVGDYSIVFSWPGQTATNGTGTPNFRGAAYVGDYYQPSTSAPATLHVQQEPITGWTEPPLPEYVTRPIHAANREWSQLASNWLKGSWLVSNFQRWGTAPNSPHILWTKQLTAGGIVDAQWPSIPTNIHNYENPWTDPIVMMGRIYYNEPPVGTKAQYGYYAIDLQTGEQIFYKNGTDNGLNNPVTYVGYASGANQAPELHQTFPALSFGSLYHYISVNGHGIAPSLWMTVGSRWYMLDVDTGNWIMTLTNVPSGTAVTDQDGSLLRYSYSSSTGRLLCWNSSQSTAPSGPTGTGQQIWKPRLGAVINAVNDTSWTAVGPRTGEYYPGVVGDQWTASDILPRSGYTMNVTVQTGLPGISRVLQDENRVPKTIFGFTIDPPILTGGLSETTKTFRAYAIRIDEHVAPYSPFPDKTFTQNNNLGFGATLLWDKNYTNPKPGVALSLGAISYDDDIFTVNAKETMQKWAYRLSTGELLWGPTTPQTAWDMYGMSDTVAYGKLYSVGYGGILYAYDAKTGKLLWNYTAAEIGYESPYGNYPLSIGAIADGKVFLYSTEHSPTKPLWRGSYIRAINATDGTEIWKLLDFNNGMAIADGYIVTSGNYDNEIYVIGKGPSAAIVTASPKVSVHGNSVLIEGTVTDQSPGALGTPAIADADMQAWMEYLYEQQAMPTNAKGVEVTLDTVDPNGNFVHIGTVTSDMSGMFKKLWTPEVPGEYTVIATFAGSESYGSSYAETAVGVTAAPQPSASPSPQPAPLLTLAPEAAYPIAGLVIAIIVALAVLMLIRQRKP
jgi:outer membrane protein assembly factor BamB